MTTDIPRSALPGTRSLTTLGTGGEGSVYALPAAVVPQQVKELVGGRQVVYKEFRTPDSPARSRHHREVVEVFRKFGTEQQQWILDRAAWPLAAVVDGDFVVGILMPTIPEMFYREFPASGGRTHRGEADFQKLLNEDRYLQKMNLQMSDKMKYTVLFAVCDLLRVLQGGGVVVGDLSAKNLMFSVTAESEGDGSASAYLIDCDSVSTPSSVTPDSVETPGWEVPSGENRQTKNADRYKFGLMVLRLLSGDQVTRDPGRLPASVPTGIRDLVVRTLTATPVVRPSFGAWWEVLQLAAATADASVPTARPIAVPTVAQTPVVATVAKRSASAQSAPTPQTIPAAPVQTEAAVSAKTQVESGPGQKQEDRLSDPVATRVRATVVIVLLLVAAYAVSMDWFTLDWNDRAPLNYNMVADAGFGGFQFRWVLYGIVLLGLVGTAIEGLFFAGRRSEFLSGGAGIITAVVASLVLRTTLVSDQIMNYGDGVSIRLTSGAWLYLVMGVLIVLLTWGFRIAKKVR